MLLELISFGLLTSRKMNPVLFIFLFLIIIQTSVGMDENRERINYGASTSRDPTNYEECELQSYAESIIRLMIAEDIDDGNLTDIMHNRFHELQAFNQDIFSYLMLAEFGGQHINDERRNLERVVLVVGEITLRLLEVIMESCSEHHTLKVNYHFDQDKNSIVVMENTQFPSDECLCGNYQERLRLSEEFSLPELQIPGRTFQFDIDRSQVSMMEPVRYYIIPLTLLSKFFNVWLSDETSESDTEYNRCALTLLARLKRSMQKLVVVQIKNSAGSSIKPDKVLLNTADAAKIDDYAFNWIHRNVFLGPPNRGLFLPEFRYFGNDSFEAFDWDVKYIIDRKHYMIMKLMYRQLKYFVEEAPKWQVHQRLIYGFQTFIEIMINLNNRGITPLNIEQWEERYLTDYDFDSLRIDESRRRELRGQKYWVIKKTFGRFSRSTNYFAKTELHSVKQKSRRQINQKWKEFVSSLFQIIMDARSQNKNLLWSKNFTNLYDKYLLRDIDVTDQSNLTCISFNKYLFSKIHKLKEWHRCNNLMNSMLNSKWCQAWKRIIKSNISSYVLDTKKLTSTKEKWSTLYLQDAETIVLWLSSIVSLKKPSTSVISLFFIKNFFVKEKFIGQNYNFSKSFGYLLT